MANLKINAKTWNSISKKDQESITKTLTDYGLIHKGDKFVASSKVRNPKIDRSLEALAVKEFKVKLPKLPKIKFPKLPGPLKSICTNLCDAAAVAAAAALTLTGPALAAALVAIEVARQACRGKC